jgi:O-methyltransferase involved in polyketide biosynthesis
VAGGFDPAAPSFFSWLGVTMYLEEAANDAVFAYIGSLPDATMVFTFATAAGHASPAADRLPQAAADVGEPWRTRYEPEALAKKLKEFGFSSVWMPTPAQLVVRYFADRPDDLPLPRRRTLVRAATKT